MDGTQTAKPFTYSSNTTDNVIKTATHSIKHSGQELILIGCRDASTCISK